MITEHDLAEAIAECEGQRNPNSNTCLKLAAFYTIRDKMYPAKQEEREEIINERPSYSYSRSADEESEFMQVASAVAIEELLPVIDELMSTIKVIIPRLYHGVMRKLTKE